MKEKIPCDMCRKEIKNNKDLVVTTYLMFFILRKYHNACYAKREKTAGGYFLVGGKPINTRVYSIMSAIGALILLGFFVLLPIISPASSPFMGFIPLIGLLLIAAILYTRIASYYKYEKKMK